MNWPGAARAAQLDRRHALDQLGVLDHHHGVGAARHHAAGGDGGRGAGPDLDLGRVAAGDHLGVERELLRRGVGRARGVGGAQREAVDIGAVERRHVDRRGEIGGQHAAERRRERARVRRAGARGRDGFRSASAPPRRRPLRGTAPAAPRRGPRRAARPAATAARCSWHAHGHGLTDDARARRMAFAVGGNQDPAFGAWPAPAAADSRCATGSTRPSRRRTGTTSASPSGEAILRPSSAANGCSSISRNAQPRQHAPADGEPAGERRVEPAGQQQHRALADEADARWSRPA